MRSPLLLALAIVAACPALAQEPVGCDKFKWPLDRERALLTDARAAKVASGSEIPAPPPTALILRLVSFQAAALPFPPERPPRASGSFAGYLRFHAVPQIGTYFVTLSDEGWLDLIRDGHYLKAADFTGARDCAGARKSVKFDVAAGPLIVQISGARAPTIGIVISPAP
jgi:hypothetical protein